MYTREQIMAMNGEELRDAMQAVQEELRNNTENDLTEVVGWLEERSAQLESRQSLMDRVARGLEGRTVRTGAPTQQPANYTVDSPEYRRYYLRSLRGDRLSREERAAGEAVMNAMRAEMETRDAVDFVATTANTTAPLPTTMLNKIWDLVTGNHCIMGDVTIYRTGTVLEIVKHVSIVQGRAKKVAENTANDDEQNSLIKVTLSGNDFSKHLDISYAFRSMSLDAMEQYLCNEIALSMGEVMSEDVVDNAIRANIANANKITAAAAEITYKEIANAFGSLKRCGRVNVYGNRKTIFSQLVGMTDQTGRPIFQPSAQAGQMGILLGAAVKEEDAVADGTLLIGDPTRVTYNMIQDIMLESDKDIKKHVVTYAGYARGEGALVDDVSFVELKKGPAAGGGSGNS